VLAEQLPVSGAGELSSPIGVDDERQLQQGMYEGGDQEGKIASTFNRYADICANWPRTSAVLRGVASAYLREAAQEDERAKARD
jgi:hypothetical protein